MIGELLAQRSDLLGGHGTCVIGPFASLVRDDVGKFLIRQRFVPWLHHRAAVLLTLHFDGTGQTLKHDHGHSVRAAGSETRNLLTADIGLALQARSLDDMSGSWPQKPFYRDPGQCCGSHA